MNATPEEIRDLIKDINHADNSQDKALGDDDFWQEAGARLLLFVDKIVQRPEIVNMWTPKDYTKDKDSILAAVFAVMRNIPDANEPFNQELWLSETYLVESDGVSENKISFYELALSRCCSFSSQLLGDRFQYVQKLLIKHLFGSSVICSILASDIYMYLVRIVQPIRRSAMSQIITNLCKLAPPEAAVMGAALVNRINKI